MSCQLSHQPARVGISGVAHYLPESIMSTVDLEALLREHSPGVPIPNGVLGRLTGIAARRVAGPEENASDLAARAALTLFARESIDPNTIDLVLFASASRDFVEPATAHVVQQLIGTKAHCLDVTNACNSFMNGIDLARAMIIAGRARRVLVCSGEVPSRAVKLALTSIEELFHSFAGYTFGDAGTAIIVEEVASGGLLHLDAFAYSQYWEIGGIFGGGTRHPREIEHTYFHGRGDELRAAFEEVGTAPVHAALASAGTSIDEVAAVICHQVTVPYLERFIDVLGIDPVKVIRTVEQYGNLASCSIPFQLSLQWDRLAPGEKVLFVGLGGGASLALAVWER